MISPAQVADRGGHQSSAGAESAAPAPGSAAAGRHMSRSDTLIVRPGRVGGRPVNRVLAGRRGRDLRDPDCRLQVHHRPAWPSSAESLSILLREAPRPASDAATCCLHTIRCITSAAADVNTISCTNEIRPRFQDEQRMSKTHARYYQMYSVLLHKRHISPNAQFIFLSVMFLLVHRSLCVAVDAYSPTILSRSVYPRLFVISNFSIYCMFILHSSF